MAGPMLSEFGVYYRLKSCDTKLIGLGLDYPNRIL